MTDDAKIIEALARKMSYRDEAPDVLSALRAAGFEVVELGRSVPSLARADVDRQDELIEEVLKAREAQARADALAKAVEKIANGIDEVSDDPDEVWEADELIEAWSQKAFKFRRIARAALSAYKEGRSDG